MAKAEASCPGCGAPIEFAVSSAVVKVCEYCHSVVARGDANLETLGKLSDVVETESPLAVGLLGKMGKHDFRVAGRAQLKHTSGGIWDEWYAYFDDGRWGWIAEAQGKFFVTFPKDLAEGVKLPHYADLELEEEIPGIAGFVVAEKGKAKPVAAEGEIPYKLTPGEVYLYADLSGPDKKFATIDYSEDEPILFTGKEVSLADLHLDEVVSRPAKKATTVLGKHINCPQCGGPLELVAPDKAQRVTCQNCHSLLDATKGNLVYLSALDMVGFEPLIELGKVGEFDGIKYQLIGAMRREVIAEGVSYPWHEYLLYNKQIGFRWLTCSNGNWSFVEPLTVGQVKRQANRAYYDNKTFKKFSDDDASVTHVLGEFYWQVSVGETTRSSDFICPPFTLSREGPPSEIDTGYPTAGLGINISQEVNWSISRYLTTEQVEKAFAITGLPKSRSVAPNQPFPYKGIYVPWLVASTALIVVAILFAGFHSRTNVANLNFRLDPTVGEQVCTKFSEKPFDLKGQRNICITVATSLENSWMYVTGHLYNEETGVTQPFELSPSYYHGTDDGEAWSEGSRTVSTYVSAVPAGKYSLRLDCDWEKQSEAQNINVKIDQGVQRFSNFAIAFLLISILPICIAIYHMLFDMRRWGQSDFSPYSQSSD